MIENYIVLECLILQYKFNRLNLDDFSLMDFKTRDIFYREIFEYYSSSTAIYSIFHEYHNDRDYQNTILEISSKGYFSIKVIQSLGFLSKKILVDINLQEEDLENIEQMYDNGFYELYLSCINRNLKDRYFLPFCNLEVVSQYNQLLKFYLSK